MRGCADVGVWECGIVGIWVSPRTQVAHPTGDHQDCCGMWENGMWENGNVRIWECRRENKNISVTVGTPQRKATLVDGNVGIGTHCT